MFDQINWSRWVLLLVIVLIIAVSNVTNVGRSQVAGEGTPLPMGRWKLNTGEMVEIERHGDRGEGVYARFSTPRRCWNQPWARVFEGALTRRGPGDTRALTISRFQACTRTRQMWEKCSGVTKLFWTDVRDVTVSPNLIKGQVLRPGYWLPEGDFSKCKPDKSQEGWEDFSLTRICPPPWLDQDTNCQDAESLHIGLEEQRAVERYYWKIFVLACGQVIYEETFFSDQEDERERAWTNLNEFRGKVCCQKFRDALSTGQPCRPRDDFDCDGKPNTSDDQVGDRTCP